MDIDRKALEAVLSPPVSPPRLRLFQWKSRCATYGYLLNEARVQAWAQDKDVTELIQRPTGGGVVVHTPNDLSLSLLWSRSYPNLPENPREAYEVIHSLIQKALHQALNKKDTTLHAKSSGSCETPKHFTECFQEPVCNDIMIQGEKVVGGALRLTKKAILYQGAIQWPDKFDVKALKSALISSFSLYLTPSTQPNVI